MGVVLIVVGLFQITGGVFGWFKKDSWKGFPFIHYSLKFKKHCVTYIPPLVFSPLLTLMGILLVVTGIRAL